MTSVRKDVTGARIKFCSLSFYIKFHTQHQDLCYLLTEWSWSKSLCASLPTGLWCPTFLSRITGDECCVYNSIQETEKLTLQWKSLYSLQDLRSWVRSGVLPGALLLFCFVWHSQSLCKVNALPKDRLSTLSNAFRHPMVAPTNFVLQFWVQATLPSSLKGNSSWRIAILTCGRD